MTALADPAPIWPCPPPQVRYRGDYRADPIPGWTVTGPDGTEYRVEQITYEADDRGQHGNPFVSRQTPVLRCVPASRCWACNGGGRDRDPRDRWLGGNNYARDRRTNPCIWCNSTGEFDPEHNWQPVAAALIVIYTFCNVSWWAAWDEAQRW